MLDQQALLQTISPKAGGQTFLIPPPTKSPFESMIHRLSFVNRYNLYRRHCDGTKKPIVSVYSPDKPIQVYARAYWESDEWDASIYGRAYDFNRTFAEQWDDLNLAVPHMNLWSTQTENADYTHDVAFVRDSYLIFDAAQIEESLYVHTGMNLTSCIECYSCVFSELLYRCMYVEKGYKSQFCSFCEAISECFFCYECKNTKNCFGCVNLQSGQYCWFNEQLSKDEYERRLAEFWAQPDFIRQAEMRLKELVRQLPHRHVKMIKTEDCTGDYMFSCKSCHESFDCDGCETLYGCHDSVKANNALYCGNLIDGPSGAYECQNIVTGAQNIAFCFLCADGLSDAYYSTECYTCDHVFGCVGLKRKKYSILNKAYTQHEYDQLLPRVIGHMQETGEWGQFLPAWTSIFGFNESAAADYAGFTEQQAEECGFNWSDYDPPLPDFPKLIRKEQYPQLPRPTQVGDEIVDWAFECTETGKLFQVQAMELLFYRTFNLPFPSAQPKQRLRRLILSKNGRHLHKRQCEKCHTSLRSTFTELSPQRIYCPSCYQTEVQS